MTGAEYAIETEGLRKSYRKHDALAGVDLTVRAGTVLGLLGPNGAGKTTTVRILATLLTPDGGTARVAGYDVVRQAREVRRRIGLAGQYAAVDELLTGRENLVLLGNLLHLGRHESRQRADRLLDRFDLTKAAARPVGSYSGGMRRRLDLASCLVGDPDVLFLDEPTTGLDPASRIELWRTVRELVDDGVTVLLTTQYLEEADALADQIAVIADGQVIAHGTADQLKRKVGDERLEIRLTTPTQLSAAMRALGGVPGLNPVADKEKATIAGQLDDGVDGIAAAATALAAAGIQVTGFAVRQPTLDDVFLKLTGQLVGEPVKLQA
jgi:ABC-2 type transport system ATP-binding protein